MHEDSAQMEKISTNLTQFVFSYLVESMKNFSNKQELEKALKNYAEKYLESHSYIKCLGINEPISIKSIYVSAEAVNHVIHHFSIESQNEAFRNENKRDFESLNMLNGRKKPAVSIANRQKNLCVLGAPGSGKSTFLKRIGVESLFRHGMNSKEQLVNTRYFQYRHRLLPIFVSLNRLTISNESIEDLIVNELSLMGFPDDFFREGAKVGMFLILLDGFDEIPMPKVSKAAQEINNLQQKYSQNRYITSCRIAFYKNFFQKSVDVVMSSFNDKQIEEFVRNFVHNFGWNSEHFGNVSQELLQELKNPNNSQTLELARTPLLLTFICIVKCKTQDIPKARTELYKLAVDLLMKEWAAEKGVHSKPLYSNKNNESFQMFHEKQLLSYVAGKMFEAGKIFFEKVDLEDRIDKFQRITHNIPKTIKAEDLLEDISIRQGLFVARSNDVFSFSHLTIQEFFCASYFSHPSRLKEIVKNHCQNVRWREVFLLMAGLENIDSRALIHEIVNVSNKIMDTSISSSFINREYSPYYLMSPDNANELSKKILFIYILSKCAGDKELSFIIRDLSLRFKCDISLVDDFTDYWDSQRIQSNFEGALKAVKDFLVWDFSRLKPTKQSFLEYLERTKQNEETFFCFLFESSGIQQPGMVKLSHKECFRLIVLVSECAEASITLLSEDWWDIKGKIFSPSRKKTEN